MIIVSILFTITVISIQIIQTHSFFNSITNNRPTIIIPSKQQLLSFHHDNTKRSRLHISSTNNNENDELLLNQITKEQLQALCKQYNISNTKGTKAELLQRLREYANEQIKADEDRRKKQIQRIEQGVDDTQGNGKAKHKVVSASTSANNDNGDNDNDDDLSGSFYFSIPGDDTKSKQSTVVKRTSTKIMNPQNNPMNTITAPLPPPGLEPDENGERVVTIYSTKDQNDLTGLASQNSAFSAHDEAMKGGYSRSDSMGQGPEKTLAGGPFGDQSGSKRKKESSKEFDAACEIISDLVLSLVQMTGAPGFQDEFTDGVLPLEYDSDENKVSNTGVRINYFNEFGFTGFDPSRVPIALITQSSKSLRVGNGDALRQVLTDFEMQAIGFDGRAGDDKERGGGHYLEVQKVGTFLEGFRKAEVRRIARETSTMLLDKLVGEGVKSLDQMLITMSKGNDESSDSGELNDSLLGYLEDAVRQQEKKVEQKLGQSGIEQCKISSLAAIEKSDLANVALSDSFWNITMDENGKVVETLDPNDPKVKAALQKELEIAEMRIQGVQRIIPTDPSQQLLILLTLLRDRVKAEALFTNDEKGRNLRILAYCLHASNDKERETIMMDNLGSSLEVSFLFEMISLL